MRRVKVKKYDRQKKAMVDDGEATFHQWGSEYEEFETGPGNFTVAIIERDDGTVETPPASWVTFIQESKQT